MRQYALHIPVPVAELDPFGELKTAALIRVLQLAAARASEDAGFDLSWYQRNGATWVARLTHLQRLEPARHGDELVVRTWVSDFRRVRSFRQYEVSRIADDAVIARAATDWVYVDAVSGAPAIVPQEIQSALMPDGVSSQQRRRRPRAASLIAEPFSLRRVELADLDSLGHVNNSQYASFVEQALIDALATAGWEPELRPDAPHLRTVDLEIEYLEAALFRQQLTTQVTRSLTSDRELAAAVEIFADGQRAVAATGRWQWSAGALPPPLLAIARSQLESGAEATDGDGYQRRR